MFCDDNNNNYNILMILFTSLVNALVLSNVSFITVQQRGSFDLFYLQMNTLFHPI